MTVRINKQKINLREKLTEFEDKVNFDEVVRGLGEYTGNVGIGIEDPVNALHIHGKADGLGYIRITDASTGSTATDGARIGYNSLGLRIQNYENTNISFLTNNSTEALTIKNDGNVGIGAATPETGYKLDVRGKTIVREQLRVLGTTGDSGSGHILLQNNFSTGSRNFYIGNGYTATSTNPNGLSIKTSSYDTTDWSSATTRLHITEFGNVGIGSTNPSSKLSVEGAETGTNLAAGNSETSIKIRNESKTDGNFACLDFYNAHDYITARVGAHFKNNSDTEGLDRNTELYFATRKNGGGLTQRMTIDEDGNVGIGTADPGAYELVLNRNNSSSRMKISCSDSSQASLFFGEDAGAGGTPAWIQRFGSNHETKPNKVEIGAAGSGSWIAIQGDGQGDILNVRGSGNVGIGTTDPSNKLDIYKETSTTSDNVFTLRSDVGGVDAQIKFKVTADGSAYTGSTPLTSDNRLKHNEQQISEAIQTLGKITPIKYIKTSNLYEANHNFEIDEDGNPVNENGEVVEHRIEAGVIAQEVMDVPELAFTVRDEELDEDGNTVWPYSLDYNSLFTYAIAAIQEQQQIIEDLKSRIETLESK